MDTPEHWDRLFNVGIDILLTDKAGQMMRHLRAPLVERQPLAEGGNAQPLRRNNKKSLTLEPLIAQIYTTFCGNSFSTHRTLDEAERLLQRALALYPSSCDRYLVILRPAGCAGESPNSSLLPWTRRSAPPIDGT